MVTKDEAGPASGVRSVAAEVARLRREIAALRRERDHYRRYLAIDPATGLYTRQHLDERLEHEWRRALHFWTPLSLIAIDVGDTETLRERGELERAVADLAGLIDTSRRDIDIPCRVGSTSFALLLPGTGRLGAEAELKRLESAAARQPELVAGLTLGFGMAVAFDDA